MSNCFPKQLHHGTFPSAVYEGPNFLTPLLTLVIICLFIIATPVGRKQHLTAVLISISLLTNDIELHFICLLLICIFFLDASLLKFFAYFFNWVVYLYIFELFSLFLLNYFSKDCIKGHWVPSNSVLALGVKHNFIELDNNKVENIYCALIWYQALLDLY